MRANVREIFSSDVEVDEYVPDKPEDDGVWLRLLVGPDDGHGEESFDVLVCTPLWLLRVVREQGPTFGRHHLIVDTMHLPKAMNYLRRRFEEVEAPTWDALGRKLAAMGHWEFDDYQVMDTVNCLGDMPCGSSEVQQG